MQDSPYRLIPLRNAEGETVAEVKVDPQTFDLLSQWRWSVGPGGYAARATQRDGRIFMHRFILGLGRGDRRQTDHINRDRLDNRRANLQVVTRALNLQNQSMYANNSSGYRGVSWDKRDKKWAAQCQIGGQKFHLGRYDDPAEAGAVVAAFRAEHMPNSDEGRAARGSCASSQR